MLIGCWLVLAIRCYAHYLFIHAVRPLVRRMRARGIDPADHHCNNVLAACAGHTPPRTRGMGYMLATMAELGITKDWQSHRNVIAAVCRAKQPDPPRAWTLLSEMEEAGLEPGPGVYHAVRQH